MARRLHHQLQLRAGREEDHLFKLHRPSVGCVHELGRFQGLSSMLEDRQYPRSRGIALIIIRREFLYCMS